ncbi:hypothetical protein Ancab_030302 [Ancistrocladus abbreviatus]
MVKGDWDGTLDPIDPLLQSELKCCGEIAHACYDAFKVTSMKPAILNFQNSSRRQEASSGRRQTANCMWYVAVSNDETSGYLQKPRVQTPELLTVILTALSIKIG